MKNDDIKEQSNNMRKNIHFVVYGKDYTLAQLCDKYNINYKAFYSYYRKNGVEKSLNKFIFED